MPLAGKMPNGTRVKHNDGRTGKTMQWLPNVGTAGGYRVQWQPNGDESEARCHEMSPEAGNISPEDYNAAVLRITAQLGGYTEKSEGTWLDSKGKAYESVLIKSTPAHLSAGQEMHAHAGIGGGIKKAHVKEGNRYVRSVFQNNAVTSEATAGDRIWLAQVKVRQSLVSSRQAYLDGRLQLPQ